MSQKPSSIRSACFNLLRGPVYLFFLALLGLAACKTPGEVIPGLPDPDTADPIDPTALVCAVGEPTSGDMAIGDISPAGGILTSESGTVRIEIPAGALTHTETIQIQSIRNTNPTGHGTAYRLEPHGITFAKPVTLTFAYTDTDLNGTIAEALQVAYQQDSGVWMAMPGIVLNKSASTISIQTTHFSDWSYFSAIYLSPQQRGLQPGESVNMNVYTTLALDDDEVFLTPLVKPLPVIKQQPIVELGPNKTVPVTQWAISERIGHLATTGAGSTNVYTAPSGIVKPTPVTVTARVKHKSGFLLLLSSMLIMPEGIVYRVDGGPWIHRLGTAQRLGGQAVIIGAAKSTDEPDEVLSLNITLPAFDGTENVALRWGASATFVAAPAFGQKRYDCYTKDGPSAGGVFINQIRYEPSNTVIEPVMTNGSFSIQQAGEWNSDYVRSHVIEGFFSLGKPL